MRLVEVFLEPRSAEEAQALSAALDRLTTGDPHFGYRNYTAVYAVEARDLFALDDKLARLHYEFGLAPGYGPASVICRDTVVRRTEVDCTFKRHMGGKGQFARIKLVFAPAEPGAGLVFHSDVVGGEVPADFLPGVIEGLESGLEDRRAATFHAVDIAVTLADGAYHDLDSSRGAFYMAAREAVTKLCKEADFKRSEPVMAVSVAAPGGDVVAVRHDLAVRGATVTDETPHGEVVIIAAEAPLEDLLEYPERLRTLFETRARLLRMDFSHFAEVPQPDSPDGFFPPAMGMRLA